MRVTGMPVQRDTTSATSCASTSSLTVSYTHLDVYKRQPYLLIVGEKEEAEGLVSVRAQGEGDKGQMSLEAFRDFIAGLVKEEIEANKLEKK